MVVARTKSLLLLCSVLVVVTIVIFHKWSNLLNTKPNVKGLLETSTPEVTGLPNAPMQTAKGRLNTLKSKVKGPSTMTTISNSSLTPKMHKWFYSPEEKEGKWKRCKKLVSGEEKVNRTFSPLNDTEILHIHKPNQDCAKVLQVRFGHPPVTKDEEQLPIAYAFTIYKGARLFERILRAIYMPNNVYCIHIDKKSPEVFRRAIEAMIRCLPNVFISANSVDVVWAHFTLVQAQLNCMEELLQSPVKWKYYISLVGQDFPLYENKEIVRALQSLKDYNNIESFPMPGGHRKRFKFVHILRHHRIIKTGKPKPQPPHNIAIYKGSTHIVAVRRFVEFVLHSQIGKVFTAFLKDTFAPDETIYASLQQHPLAPGGIHGKQPVWIPRALYWTSGKYGPRICEGTWLRRLCWITFGDLRWALGEEKKEKLFVHKIPFNFNDELIECILVARQERKYPTSVWPKRRK